MNSQKKVILVKNKVMFDLSKSIKLGMYIGNPNGGVTVVD